MMVKYFPNEVDVVKSRKLKSTDLKYEDLLEWRKGWSNARRVTPLCYSVDPASYKTDVSCNDTAIQISSLIYDFLSNQ